MSEAKTYTVPGTDCSHCVAAIKEEVRSVEGVQAVEVDLEAKVVTIHGDALSEEALRDAIEEAGYEPA